MNKGLQILIGITFLAIGGIVYLRERNLPAKPSASTTVQALQPVYEWRPMWAGQLTIGAGNFTSITVLQAPRARITLKAKDAVNFAILQNKPDSDTVRALDFSQLACAATGATDVVRECDVPGSKGFLLVSYPGTLPHLVLDALTIEAWRCTANCR